MCHVSFGYMCGPHEGTEIETSHSKVEWPELLDLQRGSE